MDQGNLNVKIELEKKENESLHERIQIINKQKNETTEQIQSSISAAAFKDHAVQRMNIEVNQASQDIEVRTR